MDMHVAAGMFREVFPEPDRRGVDPSLDTAMFDLPRLTVIAMHPDAAVRKCAIRRTAAGGEDHNRRCVDAGGLQQRQHRDARTRNKKLRDFVPLPSPMASFEAKAAHGT